MKAKCAAVVLCGCSAVACSSGLPELRFETEHFRFHARADVEVCDGRGDWLEHHYATVGGRLGAKLPADEVIEIYVFSDATDLGAHACQELGVDIGGCTDGRSVYQLDVFEPHELVHVYAADLGQPPPIFSEGLAQVFGCAWPAHGDSIEASSAAVAAALTSARWRALSAEDLEDAILPQTQDVLAGIERLARY